MGASAKEKHQFAALKLTRGTQAPAPLGHGAHRRTAGAGADHHDVAARVVGHQETGAKRADHLHRIAHLQITHVIGANAAHGLALVVFQHPLDGQRQVVVPRALTIARTGNRVLTGMVRPAIGVNAGRDDAHRLALEHRERHLAKVEHDVVGVVLVANIGHPHIAGHRGGDAGLRRSGAIQVGVGVRGRPGRQAGAVLRAADGSALRAWGQGVGGGLGTELDRQLVPSQLLGGAVSLYPRHDPPVVDRPCGAGRDAGHAEVAFVRIHHVVAVVMRDGTHRAGGLAGVATDADFGVDQVLPDHGRSAHVS